MTTATQLSTVIAIPDTTDLAEAHAKVVADAEAFIVDSQGSLERCAVLLTDNKARMKVVDDRLLEPVEKAFQAHKAAKSSWKFFMDPLLKVKVILSRKAGDHVEKQERIARAEQQRLEAEARKIEEDRRIAEAVALEKEGRAEEAEKVIEQPVFVAVPLAAKPKAPGLSMTKNYKFRVVDVTKIRLAYMMPDEPSIGQVVRRHHEAAAAMVGGIEVYTETGATTRSV